MKINVIPKFGDVVAWDTEFSGQQDGKLHIPHGKFVALGVYSEGEVYLYDNTDILPEVFRKLKDCKLWVIQNSLYDLRQMTRFVPNLLDNLTKIWDTEIVEHYVRTDYSSYNLDNLSRRWLGKGVVKGMYEKLGDETYDMREVLQYLANDVTVTYEVFSKQKEHFKKYQNLISLYFKIDEPIIRILAKMSLRDIAVDYEGMMKWAEEVDRKVEELSSKISFNPNSPKQIKDFFLLKYRIVLENTTADTLEKVKSRLPDSEELEALLQLKRMGKLRSTYGKSWIEKYVTDGNVRADVRVYGTETGRITYQNPNLQQIPARNFPIYRTFIQAHEGNQFLVADISQQEPRLTAYIAREPKLQQYFRDNVDIHLEVARRIYNDPTLTKEKNKHERDVGKAINLGISYGLSAKGLSENTGLDLLRAEQIINDYFREFPYIQNYITTKRNFAQINGYVETITGRRLNINTYKNSWSNTAINFPIQGSGADVLKLWMIYITEKCERVGLPFPLLLCIHDEIVSEIPAGMGEEYGKILQEALDDVSAELMPEAPYKFEMEYAVGDNWACKK